MLRTLNFPAGILPIAVTLGELLAHGPALLVMIAIVLTAYAPSPVWLLLLLVVLLQSVFNLGLGLIVARLTVHFHDFTQLLGHLLKMWLLASGVLFPIDQAPEGLIRDSLEANPAYVFIVLTRSLLLEGVIDPAALRAAIAWSVAMLVVGVLFFHRYEGRYSSAS
jgi:teichoic acid transport system permease protein